MSGVMIKLGVYGLFRLGFDWLGDGPAWWGATLLLVGAASALLGVLYALVEHDLKRLLAYHSVENVGIILLGLGAGMVFRGSGLGPLATLGVVAALYHTANHAAFKALLFLGAGAVLHATGTRNMEAMGGLIKRMPWTAACFLVGSAAIAALPPLNGFVSEWLTFQALLQSVSVPHPELNLVFLLGLAGLALTGGLAAACFVKAFGIASSRCPERGGGAGPRVPVTLRVGMVALPPPASRWPRRHPRPAGPRRGRRRHLGRGRRPAVAPAHRRLTVVVGEGSPSPARRRASRRRSAGGDPRLRLLGARRDRACTNVGVRRSLQTARMEYTATAFSQPFKRIFAVLYRPVKQLDIEFHPESRFVVRTIHYENPTRSIIEEWLYLPALGGAQRLAGIARRIQSGSANLYLAYIFVTLLVLLLVAR
jgi:hydrogenase-4 component B